MALTSCSRLKVPEGLEVRVLPRLGPAGGVGVDGGAEGLERGLRLARPGLGCGEAVQRVLVPRVLGHRLAEVLDRPVELAPVVEDDPVVEHLLERLWPGRPPGLGPVAHRQIGAGPLDEVRLVLVALDQVVQVRSGALEILATEGLDGLLEEVHRLPIAPVTGRRGGGLFGHPPSSLLKSAPARSPPT
jgi:hypothetical protein